MKEKTNQLLEDLINELKSKEDFDDGFKHSFQDEDY